MAYMNERGLLFFNFRAEQVLDLKVNENYKIQIDRNYPHQHLILQYNWEHGDITDFFIEGGAEERAGYRIGLDFIEKPLPKDRLEKREITDYRISGAVRRDTQLSNSLFFINLSHHFGEDEKWQNTYYTFEPIKTKKGEVLKWMLEKTDEPWDLRSIG